MSVNAHKDSEAQPARKIDTDAVARKIYEANESWHGPSWEVAPRSIKRFVRKQAVAAARETIAQMQAAGALRPAGEEVQQ